MATSYAEKLRDPRWQKKRLGILNRQDWKCAECSDAEKELHVHHCYYERGLNPWDYPDSALKALCRECHETRASVELRIQMECAGYPTEALDVLICDILYACSEFGIYEVRDALAAWGAKRTAELLAT